MDVRDIHSSPAEGEVFRTSQQSATFLPLHVSEGQLRGVVIRNLIDGLIARS